MAGTARQLRPIPLVRGVRRWDLVALMINCIIGAGIFGLPSQTYSLTGTYSLLAFAVCGLIVGVIAICYAEVSSRFQATGGPYLYAREAFGPLIGYQIGWIAWLARLGSLAFVGNVLVSYLSYFWPSADGPLWRNVIICGVFVALTAINILGVSRAAVLSDVLTVGKLVPVLLFISVGLFFINPHSYSFVVRPHPRAFWLSVSQLVFAFTGFELGSIATGEARDPQRNMPFAILTALGVVTLLYIMIQTVCIGTLPNLASTQKPLSDASELFLGRAGASIITAGVLISATGNLSAILLAGPRLLFAMAERGQLPPVLARVHPRFRTPYPAILVTAALGLALAISGTFRYTLTVTAISKLITFIASCAALPVFRSRGAVLPALLRAPAGIPLSIAGVVLCTWLLASSGWRELRDVGLAAILGFVVYFAVTINRGTRRGFGRTP